MPYARRPDIDWPAEFAKATAARPQETWVAMALRLGVSPQHVQRKAAEHRVRAALRSGRDNRWAAGVDPLDVQLDRILERRALAERWWKRSGM